MNGKYLFLVCLLVGGYTLASALNLRKSPVELSKKVAAKVNYTVTRIQLIDYNNPRDVLADGSKCDPSFFNYHKCDPFFLVTYRGGNTTVTVKYNETIWEDVSYVAFDVRHGLNVTAVYGSPLSVAISAMDEDVLTHDLIGWFNFNDIAYPGNNAIRISTVGGVAMRVRFQTWYK